MKTKIIGSFLFTLFFVLIGINLAQVRVLTCPHIPTPEILRRLSLNLGWNSRVKLESSRDGIYTVQMVPGKTGSQIVVQTLAGAVNLLDAETGDLIWRTSVGVPYWEGKPVAFNSHSIFATRRNMLYVLNRVNGLQRVYSLDRDSGQPSYGFPLDGSPSASPLAVEDRIFFAFGNRIAGYFIPNFDAAERYAQSKAGQREAELQGTQGQSRTGSLQPEIEWTLALDGNVEFPGLASGLQCSFALNQGGMVSLDQTTQNLRGEFPTQGKIIAPPGQFGKLAYFGSTDSTVYALDMEKQEINWRILGPTLTQKPAVTENDVFFIGNRQGMFRADRITGRQLWQNKQAEKFLAANPKFVYALDRLGHLLVLDGLRGTTLSNFDTRDWPISLSNELSDRVYFAAQDGQIMCLHHRDYIAPLANKTDWKNEEKKIEKKEEKKEEEEKKDEKKLP